MKLPLLTACLASSFAATSISAASAQSIRPISAAQLKKEIAARRGRAVIVNVWATWCPPCLAELPALAKLQKTYEKRGLSLILVNADEPKDVASRVRPLLKKNNFARSFSITGPLPRWGKAFDPKNRDDFLLPRTFVYNRQGRRVRLLEGPLKYAQWQALVKPLLK
jgi:thiol-disulfide isomerase/thioredoxin